MLFILWHIKYTHIDTHNYTHYILLVLSKLCCYHTLVCNVIRRYRYMYMHIYISNGFHRGSCVRIHKIYSALNFPIFRIMCMMFYICILYIYIDRKLLLLNITCMRYIYRYAHIDMMCFRNMWIM